MIRTGPTSLPSPTFGVSAPQIQGLWSSPNAAHYPIVWAVGPLRKAAGRQDNVPMGHAVVSAEQVAERYGVVHETHTGLVVLVGDLAYKVKKPIRTDFLDFSSAERREHVCQRELELNQRLAPDSYLGVAHLDAPWTTTREPVLVMKRHPDSSRLSAMVGCGEPVTGPLEAIAGVLARFHHGARRDPGVQKQGSVDAVKRRWEANIAEMQQFVGTIVDEHRIATVHSLAVQFIAGRELLFARRVRDGRIVDGHGDLLADDIFCLPRGPEILDCLEFDDNLRYVDMIDDAAFLAMDLEFLGRKDLSELFLAHYSHLAADSAPQSLRDFYIAYRALVRAKVDCVRCSQGHRDSAADASRHLDIALDHLRACRVRVAVVGGGPGTGKSTLAEALGEKVGAAVISTDDVRRTMQSAGAITGEDGVLDAGLYSAHNVAAVYRETLHRAELLLANGRSVILDGTWRDAHRRDQVRQLAAQTYSAEIEFMCEAPVATAARRVAARPSGSMSDATPQIAVALADVSQDWPEAHRIDTNCPIAESVCTAAELWRSAADDSA